jgi:hypothetical protein
MRLGRTLAENAPGLRAHGRRALETGTFFACHAAADQGRDEAAVDSQPSTRGGLTGHLQVFHVSVRRVPAQRNPADFFPFAFFRFPFSFLLESL